MALMLAILIILSALPVTFAADEPSFTTGEQVEITAGETGDATDVSDAARVVTGDAADALADPPPQTPETMGPPATEGVPYPDPKDAPQLTIQSNGISPLAGGQSVTNDQTMHMYFTRYNGSYWQPLQTPTHYTSAGKMAYCVEQTKGSPVGYSYTETAISTGQSINVNGSEFYPAVLEGICAIIRSGYPASTLGMPADAARQTTALAIRV